MCACETFISSTIKRKEKDEPTKVTSVVNISFASRSTFKMRLLISFIAFFAITSHLVIADLDIDTLETNGKHADEHDASLTYDGNFFATNQYFAESDVESVPAINGNVSIGNRSGKLYNYDDYLGSIDMYPDYGNYDYGKFLTNETPIFCAIFCLKFIISFGNWKCGK